MQNTVLITGANGLLGQKLVKMLLPFSEEWNILASAKGPNRLGFEDGYTYISLDITDEEALKKVFERYQPKAVINCAAMTNVDLCEVEKEGCWELNVTAVRYLANLCSRYSAHFIHLSTDFIFDGTAGPYTEDGVAKPVSYYGLSKWEAEKIVQACDVKWTIVRTVLVYGIVHEMSRSNIVLWAKDALESGKEISVVDDQFRTPTLAEDLADGCIKILLLGKEGIYNISGKDFLSVYQMVEKVAEFYHLPMDKVRKISSESLNQSAKRPPVTGFVIEKAKKDLAYDPVSFEEGIQILDIQLEA